MILFWPLEIQKITPLPELEDWIEIGASPRATVNFPKAARVLAFFEGRDFVSIDDIKRVAIPILRHRLILSYEAQAEENHSGKDYC